MSTMCNLENFRFLTLCKTRFGPNVLKKLKQDPNEGWKKIALPNALMLSAFVLLVLTDHRDCEFSHQPGFAA